MFMNREVLEKYQQTSKHSLTKKNTTIMIHSSPFPQELQSGLHSTDQQYITNMSMCVFIMTKKNYCLPALFPNSIWSLCCMGVPNFSKNDKPIFKSKRTKSCKIIASYEAKSQPLSCISASSSHTGKRAYLKLTTPWLTLEYTDMRPCCSVTMYI